MTTGPDQGHCKTRKHLDVTSVAPSKADLHIGDVKVTHLDVMPCQPNAPQDGPGVLIQCPAHPSGLKLLPDAVAWLPGALRNAAVGGKSAFLQHTAGGPLIDWAHFDSACAVDTAAKVAAAA